LKSVLLVEELREPFSESPSSHCPDFPFGIQLVIRCARSDEEGTKDSKYGDCADYEQCGLQPAMGFYKSPSLIANVDGVLLDRGVRTTSMTPYRYKILDWTGIHRVGPSNLRFCNLQPEISNSSNFKFLFRYSPRFSSDGTP